MTRRARVFLPAALVLSAVASSAALVVSSPAPVVRVVPPPVGCGVPAGGVYRCVFPSPAHPAVVFVRVFEDGSAVTSVVDPDGAR